MLEEVVTLLLELDFLVRPLCCILHDSFDVEKVRHSLPDKLPESPEEGLPEHVLLDALVADLDGVVDEAILDDIGDFRGQTLPSGVLLLQFHVR